MGLFADLVGRFVYRPYPRLAKQLAVEIGSAVATNSDQLPEMHRLLAIGFRRLDGSLNNDQQFDYLRLSWARGVLESLLDVVKIACDIRTMKIEEGVYQAQIDIPQVKVGPGKFTTVMQNSWKGGPWDDPRGLVGDAARGYTYNADEAAKVPSANPEPMKEIPSLREALCEAHKTGGLVRINSDGRVFVESADKPVPAGETIPTRLVIDNGTRYVFDGVRGFPPVELIDLTWVKIAIEKIRPGGVYELKLDQTTTKVEIEQRDKDGHWAVVKKL